MATTCNVPKIMITLIAGSCGLVALAYPDWRSEIHAQTSLPTRTIAEDTALSADNEGGIVIDADDFTLDCDGHVVFGNRTPLSVGIQLVRRKGVTVVNCRVTDFGTGIVLIGSIANVFENNDVFNNVEEGIELEKSQNNLFLDNRADQNERDGFDLDDSDGNTLIENDANRNGFNGFEMDRSNHNFYSGNMASENGRRANRSGFSFDVSASNVFLNNVAEDNRRNGFRIGNSFDNAFIENTASGNGEADCVMIGAGDALVRNQFVPEPQAQFTVPGNCTFIVRPPGD